jgi:stress-induced morphogen
MSNQIEEVRLTDLDTDRICKLIKKAGFNPKRIQIGDKSYIHLEDKNNTNADKYSELTFRTFIEAARAIQPYIMNKFKLVA